MGRKPLGLLLVLACAVSSAETPSTSTIRSSDRPAPISPEGGKKLEEISANKNIARPPKDDMTAIISDLDFFYSMDFAVSLPVLENYEVVESTTPLFTEEPK